MTATPMAVQTRPFALEPVTNIMLPDGIFDNALYKLTIACHYTNTGTSPLHNVSLYLEAVADPGIAVTARTYWFPTIDPGASVLVTWSADFQYAAPGKPLVSFVATADGHDAARSIQQIFVTQTRYDDVAKKWTCTIPEGRLEITHIYAIPPAADWSHGGDDCCCCTCRPGTAPPEIDGPHVPTGITFTWAPNPPFTGQYGDLPFSDPWWKVLAIIVAVIAAIVGAIAAAAGKGSVNVGVKGSYNDDPAHPSVKCCTPSPGGSFSNNATTVAGVAGTIASVALAVACSDAADPIYRGEQNTVPAAGETTLYETVQARWKFSEAPNAGVPYRTHVTWHYKRVTSGATYTYHVDEEQTNIHVVDRVEIDTPDTVVDETGEGSAWLWATAKFTKPGGVRYKGPELYTFCFFQSPGPNGLYFLVPLLDDGRGLDEAADDGIYTAGLRLDVAKRALARMGAAVDGVWKVFVYAQEVNRTLPGTAPVLAAQTIGGNFIASAVSLTFDPTLPCPLKAQASITVR
ncbi:choice-of-anchor X domain-containing protein [Nocardia terpenica]|nr:choice-of-anchor X domain-containing protein [Nocardia terpenica]